MNYEEIREKYNEVMYDERDIIAEFLKEQADISYGTQMFEYALSPTPFLALVKDNKSVGIHEIILDNDKVVVFFATDGNYYECYDFHYGELAKIIEILPDVNELKKKEAISDLKIICKDCSVNLEENPFKLNSRYHVSKVFLSEGEVYATILANDEYLCNKALSIMSEATELANFVKCECLHRSNEYKRLMELLSLEENLYFNLVEEGKPGNASFYLHGTDCTFDVLDVSRDDSGNLKIFGKMWHEDDLLGEISLEEKDIRPEYLNCIIETIEKVRIPDIINVYNAHNPELVKKINEAWRKDRNRFAPILKALYERDKYEFVDAFGYYIEEGANILNDAYRIMEGVCDDWDLETILSFLRIK